MAMVLKTIRGGDIPRGFESHALRWLARTPGREASGGYALIRVARTARAIAAVVASWAPGAGMGGPERDA